MCSKRYDQLVRSCGYTCSGGYKRSVNLNKSGSESVSEKDSSKTCDQYQTMERTHNCAVTGDSYVRCAAVLVHNVSSSCCRADLGLPTDSLFRFRVKFCLQCYLHSPLAHFRPTASTRSSLVVILQRLRQLLLAPMMTDDQSVLRLRHRPRMI